MPRSLAGEAKVASGGCTESTEIHSNFESQSENVVMCRDTHSDLFVRFFFSLRCFLSQSYVRQHTGTYTIYVDIINVDLFYWPELERTVVLRNIQCGQVQNLSLIMITIRRISANVSKQSNDNLTLKSFTSPSHHPHTTSHTKRTNLSAFNDRADIACL